MLAQRKSRQRVAVALYLLSKSVIMAGHQCGRASLTQNWTRRFTRQEDILHLQSETTHERILIGANLTKR